MRAGAAVPPGWCDEFRRAGIWGPPPTRPCRANPMWTRGQLVNANRSGPSGPHRGTVPASLAQPCGQVPRSRDNPEEPRNPASTNVDPAELVPWPRLRPEVPKLSASVLPAHKPRPIPFVPKNVKARIFDQGSYGRTKARYIVASKPPRAPVGTDRATHDPREPPR